MICRKEDKVRKLTHFVEGQSRVKSPIGTGKSPYGKTLNSQEGRKSSLKDNEGRRRRICLLQWSTQNTALLKQESTLKLKATPAIYGSRNIQTIETKNYNQRER